MAKSAARTPFGKGGADARGTAGIPCPASIFFLLSVSLEELEDAERVRFLRFFEFFGLLPLQDLVLLWRRCGGRRRVPGIAKRLQIRVSPNFRLRRIAAGQLEKLQEPQICIIKSSTRR